MPTEQRALIVRAEAEGSDGLEELNIELQRGWRVAQVVPMGGTGLRDEDSDTTAPARPFLAALVIIERRERPEEGPVVETMEEVQDEPEPIGEPVVEGDGANPELADEPPSPGP